MSLHKSKLRLICAFAALATLALAASCRGFFVNPTLNSIAIGPATVSMAPDATQQMQAIGTYSDGSTKDVTGKASWNSSDSSVASFSTSVVGQLVATSLANLPNPPGTTTVSASVGAIASTSNATVTVCPVVTNITIGATPTSIAGGGTISFTATAIFQGVSGSQTVTDSVTWNISNSSILTISGGTGTTTSGNTGTTSVSATLCGATSSAITITVT